jgi:hypothetical protein
MTVHADAKGEQSGKTLLPQKEHLSAQINRRIIRQPEKANAIFVKSVQF